MTPDNTGRNRRILDLADKMSSGAIAKALSQEFPGITRNVVIGVVQRHGAKDPQSIARRASLNKGGHREAARKRDAAKARKAQVDVILAQGIARKVIPPTRPEYLPRGHHLTTPLAGSTPVPAEMRRGCVWPFGERDSITFCDLPKCKVVQNGRTFQTSYCAKHWEIRRSSCLTRILTDRA
jgi:hypothetical protein